MRWLTVRLRARRINQIAMHRLREKYMQHLKPTDDNEQQADLCAQFEMRRRKITAQDVKMIREIKRLCGDIQARKLSDELEVTRVQRILGWDLD